MFEELSTLISHLLGYLNPELEDLSLTGLKLLILQTFIGQLASFDHASFI